MKDGTLGVLDYFVSFRWVQNWITDIFYGKKTQRKFHLTTHKHAHKHTYSRKGGRNLETEGWCLVSLSCATRLNISLYNFLCKDMLLLLWVNLPGHRLILCFMYCRNVKIFQAYWAFSQVMLTFSASSPELACVHCIDSIHPVSVTCHLSVVLISIHVRVRGIMLTLCVYSPFYLLWRTFRLNILFQFNGIIFLYFQVGCVSSCILHSFLNIHNSPFPC